MLINTTCRFVTAWVAVVEQPVLFSPRQHSCRLMTPPAAKTLGLDVNWYVSAEDTRLIMDATIGHVFDTHHNFKPNTLLSLSNSKFLKYAEHYQRQRLAFAPIVANTLGQCGPDTLQYLWNLADHEAKNTFGFTLDSPVTDYLSQTSPPSTHKPSRSCWLCSPAM